jgi:hypothetical protein
MAAESSKVRVKATRVKAILDPRRRRKSKVKAKVQAMQAPR